MGKPLPGIEAAIVKRQDDGAWVAVDAPDEETATALTLSVASLGNIRTETLRAFSAEEMSGILAKMS